MAKRVGDFWPTVKTLIELFTAMGCELHTLPGRIHHPDGGYTVRFLYNAEADDFVSLSDLTDEERIPPSGVENWERRLGVTVPKNWQ